MRGLATARALQGANFVTPLPTDGMAANHITGCFRWTGTARVLPWSGNCDRPLSCPGDGPEDLMPCRIYKLLHTINNAQMQGARALRSAVAVGIVASSAACGSISDPAGYALVTQDKFDFS